MSSTFTTYAGLEKPEQNSVEWDIAINANADTIDEGIRAQRFSRQLGAEVSKYQLVGFDPSTGLIVPAYLSDMAGAVRCIGMALQAGVGTDVVPILRAGPIVDDGSQGWAFTIGSRLYLGESGAIVDEDSPLRYADVGAELRTQPIGTAIASNEIDFYPVNWARLGSNLIVGNASPTAGTPVLSFITSSGNGKALVYDMAVNDRLVYAFLLPATFRGFEDAAVWAWQVAYKQTTTGQLGIYRIYDGGGGELSDDFPANGTSSSWAVYQADMEVFSTLSGYEKGRVMYVEIECKVGSGLIVETSSALRFFTEDLF
jgi:hypothetical protein